MDPTQGQTLETTALATPAPTFPTGLIDFNKPFDVVCDYTDVKMESPEIIRVLKSSDYPILIAFTDADGDEEIEKFNADGDSESDDYRIEQVADGPRVVWGILQQNDGDLVFDGDVYSSESKARDAAGENDIVFSVTVPAPKVVESAPEAPTDAGTSRYVSPIGTVTVGGKIQAYRRGFGHRTVEIVKFRDHPSRSVFVKPDDGSNPYWAVNRNLSRL